MNTRASNQSPPFSYRMLLLLLFPLLVLMVLIQGWKVRCSRFVLQRLGVAYPSGSQNTVWIHCASVGEVAAAKPLIDRLIASLPAQNFLVSTTTPTGAAAVARWNLQQVSHQYLPLDFSYAVSRMLSANTPAALLVLETEIWPNLINACVNRDLPVVMVNGRLSGKTLNSPGWMRAIYRQAMSRVTRIFARTDADKEKFLSLGADEKIVSVVGNIKYSALPSTDSSLTCPVDVPFWLLASTHEDEEAQLCTLLERFEECANRLLIIAPRHPDRSASIQDMLQREGLRFAVRSTGQTVTAQTQVYLADRLGEMTMWYAHAQAVFMGGSLVDVGGHNILEPAAAGRAILTGPHIQNIKQDAELLLSADALCVCDTAETVLQEMNRLLKDDTNRQAMGDRGRSVLDKNRDIADRYLQAVLPLIPVQQ